MHHNNKKIIIILFRHRQNVPGLHRALTMPLQSLAHLPMSGQITYTQAFVETDVNSTDELHIIGFRKLECSEFGGQRVSAVECLEIAEYIWIY